MEIGGPDAALTLLVTSRIFRLGFLALLLLPAACHKREQSSALQRHPFQGVIRSVDAAHSEIVVSHEDIPGYMPGMTMAFPVKDDPRVIAVLRAGDRIEATLVVDGSRYWLEKILTKGFVPTPAQAPSAAPAAGTPAAVTPEPNRAVAVGDPVPDFALIDQTGSLVRLSQFRGQPVAITFIYTRCPILTACPMTTAKFSRLDVLLADKKFGELLTLTLDPEHDTPKVLADYAKKTGSSLKHWRFLTGDPRAVADVASHFGILYYSDHGQLVHGQGVGVIDPKGRLAAIYYGNDWQPEQILGDLEKARSEPAS